MRSSQYTGKYEKRRSVRLPLSVWLSYILVITMVLTGVTLSGYVSSASDEQTARVAVMGAGAQMLVTDQLHIAPGETLEIPFEICNKDELGRVCEVALRYTLSVRNIENNLPLTWELYYGNETGVSEGSLKAGEAQSDRYTLKVSWPTDKNDAALAFEVDAFEISIVAEQISGGGGGA